MKRTLNWNHIWIIWHRRKRSRIFKAFKRIEKLRELRVEGC
jgi:hypothetical protein